MINYTICTVFEIKIDSNHTLLCIHKSVQTNFLTEITSYNISKYYSKTFIGNPISSRFETKGASES